MRGSARAFYANLFSPDLTDADARRVLWTELLTVSAGNRDRLELPLSLAELSEALRRMPTNKSPGMDGLTMEFYRMFWDVLGPDLVIVWAKSLQREILPLSCRQAVLALLPKKGDLCDLWNWRPISLLSMDYKVVAKAISLQLGSVLADVVHPDQTYTIPGWTIFDNLYLVRDLLELGRRDGLSFAFLSLDQEKAFDRVDHGDLDDLVWVEACQAVYLAASSTWVNWVKSSGLVVRDGWQANSLPPTFQAIRWSPGPLLYLGIYLSATHPSLLENWQDLEARVCEQLRRWTGLFWCLSLRGRALVLNQLVLSMLWH
ncbi:unnamed protein product [Caretta caretta]